MVCQYRVPIGEAAQADPGSVQLVEHRFRRAVALQHAVQQGVFTDEAQIEQIAAAGGAYLAPGAGDTVFGVGAVFDQDAAVVAPLGGDRRRHAPMIVAINNEWPRQSKPAIAPPEQADQSPGTRIGWVFQSGPRPFAGLHKVVVRGAPPQGVPFRLQRLQLGRVGDNFVAIFGARGGRSAMAHGSGQHPGPRHG